MSSPVASGGNSSSYPLSVGTNSLQILVTAQDGVTTKTYTITVTRAASTDATLSSLGLDTGAFAPAVKPGFLKTLASYFGITSAKACG